MSARPPVSNTPALAPTVAPSGAEDPVRSLTPTVPSLDSVSPRLAACEAMGEGVTGASSAQISRNIGFFHRFSSRISRRLLNPHAGHAAPRSARGPLLAAGVGGLALLMAPLLTSFVAPQTTVPLSHWNAPHVVAGPSEPEPASLPSSLELQALVAQASKLSQVSAAGATHVLELPPAETHAPSVQVAYSPQLELAALVYELASNHAPVIDTPPRVDAYSNAGALSQSSAIQVYKQLEALGMNREILYHYLLLHSAPPTLTLKGRVVTDGLPASELRLLHDSKADLKKFTEALRKLYTVSRMEKLLERHGRSLETAYGAYASAFPDQFPIKEVAGLTEDVQPNSPIFLVPSLLASAPIRFRAPLEGAGSPYRISVLPVSDLSNLRSEAAFMRYTEVSGWVLEPTFRRFAREMQEASGIGLPLSEQIVRALYFVMQADASPDEVSAWRSASLSAGYSLIPAIEEKLKPWLADRGNWKTLGQYLPELMEHAALVYEGKASLPRLSDPGFEKWNGAVLDQWTVEVVEPALSGMARPSIISRARGEARNGWALMLSGDKQTNEWQGVMSEPLLVLPGDKVTVSGRMRSVNVSANGRRVTAAHLEARVLSRDGAVLRRLVSTEFSGSQPWADVRFEFTVPAGADRMHLGAVLAMPGELYFDNVNVSVDRPEVRRFLRNGSFEVTSGVGPMGWESGIAARQTQSGPTTASRWELDYETPMEGKASLKMAGDAQTSQWIEMRSTPVAVSPGQRVTLTGFTRSRGVSLSSRQHRHANLTITFLSATGAEISTMESPAVEGNTGWTPVELEVVAPLEAVNMRVGCLLTMSGEIWFDDIHLSRR